MMIKGLFDYAFRLLEKHVILRFIISGGTSAVVDLLLLFLLNTVLGVHYIAASILAFLGAFGVSFTLHKFWTFKSHGDSTHRQAILYFGTSLFGLFLNTVLMYVFVDHIFSLIFVHMMKVNVLVSQIVVGLIVACVSFFLSHRFVFKYKKQDSIVIEIQ